MITNISQRWMENGRQKFVIHHSPFIPSLHEVAKIDRETAKQFVLKNHYAASMPAARRCFGLFKKGILVGVAVFSHSMNENTLTNAFGGIAKESIELGRFCLLDEVEFNAESWFIAVCRNELKKEGFRGIVAFADDCPRTSTSGEIVHVGHIGTIYAASNAIYAGRGEKNIIRLLPNGKVISKRAISKIRNLESGYEYAAKILTDLGASHMPIVNISRQIWLKMWLEVLTRCVVHPGNHRYLLPLQKGLNLPKSLPYPKVKFNEGQLSLF